MQILSLMKMDPPLAYSSHSRSGKETCLFLSELVTPLLFGGSSHLPRDGIPWSDQGGDPLPGHHRENPCTGQMETPNIS